MIVRLMLIGGAFRFVWFVPADCVDAVEGLPIPVRPGAYRRSIYPSPNPSGSAVRAAAAAAGAESTAALSTLRRAA